MTLRVGRLTLVVGLLLGLPPVGPAVLGLDLPKPGDDSTFRPTVMVRRGDSIGSGTVIASVEGETLVLTASHVLAGSGPVSIELFRFNLGLERTRNANGFPRRLKATIVARDLDADLAVLRVGGQLAFPYVARVARENASPLPGTPVTSIGFDRGGRPIGASTRVVRIERIDMEHGGGGRQFLVTDHPPEVGRSGGGLFLEDGSLVGVCVARADLGKGGRTIGLFSTLGNINALLDTDKTLATAVARPPSR